MESYDAVKVFDFGFGFATRVSLPNFGTWVGQFGQNYLSRIAWLAKALTQSSLAIRLRMPIRNITKDNKFAVQIFLLFRRKSKFSLNTRIVQITYD